MRCWWIGVPAVVLLAATAQGQGLHDDVELRGSRTVVEAIAALSGQTGVRFAGVAGLTDRRRWPLDLAGGLGAVLPQLARETGLVITRTGLYDYLVLPAPPTPPRPEPTTTVGDLRLAVAGLQDSLRGGAAAGDEPRRLVVELRVTAASDRAAAAFQGFDAATLELVDEQGQVSRLLAEAYRPPAGMALRLGRCSLPFEPPAPTARTVTLRGELLRFEELVPLQLELDPTAVGARVSAGDLTVGILGQQQAGQLWTVDLELRRPVVLGDREPWIEAVAVAADGALQRPLELSCTPLEEAAEDDRLGLRCRLSWRATASPAPARLRLLVLERRRPWGRARFALPGLRLPEPLLRHGNGR